MTDEMLPYGTSYEQIIEICSNSLAETSRTDPALFDVITGRLAAAGIKIARKETSTARGEYPNLVAMVQLLQNEKYLDYILMDGDQFNIYPFDGEVLATIISENEALRIKRPKGR